jgi:hypothetical protein
MGIQVLTLPIGQIRLKQAHKTVDFTVEISYILQLLEG